jgi:hypothetical protein
MPDWRAYVEDQLVAVSNSRAVDSEIIRELAEHLEEYYTELRAAGLSEERAHRLTCEKVGSWKQLREEIVSVKKEFLMQNRVKQLWIPGLVTLLASAALLSILEYIGIRPLVFHPGEPSSMVLYIPWLACLPVLGALGGFLSRRAQAGGLAPHFSSTFPALVMAVVLLLIFVGALFTDRQVSLQLKAIGFWAAGLNWVVLPGAALLLGDLAFHWMLNPRAESH